MREKIIKRILAAVLTVILMGNLLLPESAVTAVAKEINIEEQSVEETEPVTKTEPEEEQSKSETGGRETEQPEAETDSKETEQSVNGQQEEKLQEAEQQEKELQEENRQDVLFEAIHIGQTRDVEKLFSADDFSCIYDMPILLTEASEVRLFVSWSKEDVVDKKEEGILTWSILKGDKGTRPGSVSLIDSEDDWMGFEPVISALNFTLREDEDENSSFYKTLTVVANSSEEDEDYDYYIRAVFQSGENQTEHRAIVTLPVIIETDKADTMPENAETAEGDVETEAKENTDAAANEQKDAAKAAEADAEMAAGADPDAIEENAEITAQEETEGEIPEGDAEENNSEIIAGEETGQEEDTLAAAAEQADAEQADSEQTAAEQTDAEKNHDAPIDENGNIMEISNEIWVAGFERESNALTYTGKRITQNLRVYHEGRLLKENTDYTLTYKNNINAAPYNSSKAPSVTVTMKGQYSGGRTLYFTIAPRDIDENHSMGYEQVVWHSKKMKIPVPSFYYDGKKLVLNKDFVCDYSSLPGDYTQGASYEAGQCYEYTVRGTGNFTGSFTMTLAVIQGKGLDFGTALISLDKKQYEYHGEALTKEDVQITAVKLNNQILDESMYEYEVYAESVGTGYIEVYPSQAGRDADLRGAKKQNIKVAADRNLKNCRLGENWQDSIVFSRKEVKRQGGICQSDTGLLIYGSGEEREVLIEGKDYTVTYSNHKKTGTATAAFKGTGRYTGSFKKTYKVTANTDLYLEWNDTDEDGIPVVPYMKGGAAPKFRLMESMGEDDGILDSKTDYSVKLKNNYRPGIMTCEITGKGNYKGYKSITEVRVLPADISQGTMSLQDRAYSSKKNVWKSAVTIKDVNGKKLTAGTDYSKILVYNYENMENDPVPAAGTTVYVTAVGINNYAGSSITGSYRIYHTAVSKLTVLIDDREYTGKEIELSAEDIHVYANKNDVKKGIEITEPCYEILAYSNNIKAGTAKVTLRGVGDYGGTRVCSFKIKKKEYLTARVTEVRLEETSVSMGVGSSRQLVATVAPENAWNKTLLWSTSNNNIVSVSQEGIITAKKPGKATITAVSQDTGKKASCKVTAKVIPVTSFSLNATEIHQEEGTKYQLTALEIRPEEASYDTIKWESTRPETASVDETGMVSLNRPGMAVIKACADEGRFVRKCLVIVDAKDDSGIEGMYLTPQMFRTSQEENDTKAFNEAIQNLSEDCNTLYVPAGTYLIDAGTSINLRSNMNLVMSPDAVLKAVGNSRSFYDIIHVSNVSNIIISGGRIVGERYEHGGSAGEWGMGIGLYDSADVLITDVHCLDCWGDGIYIGSHHEEDTAAGCNQITVTNCNLYNNRRNNLSIVCGDNITIDNCIFRNANGTAPEFGIDIETNNSNNPCEHIVISDSVFEGNGKGSMGIITGAEDIRISGCELKGDFVNYAGKGVVISDSVIRGEVNARMGILLTENSSINDGGEAEDELAAAFYAAESDCSFGKYGIDSANSMSCSIIEDSDSPSGKALCLKRLSKGTQEAGYTLSLNQIAETAALKKGATYRFEYTVKGSGQWGIKTNQTGWYPCVPASEGFSMGAVTYQAGSGKSCTITLYAVDKTKNMQLEIDSIKIYEVK